MTQILLSRYVKRVKSGEMDWSVADIVMETWPQSRTLSSITNATPLQCLILFANSYINLSTDLCKNKNIGFVTIKWKW